MNETISIKDKNFVIDCINRNTWYWAKTMPTIPHEYIVRSRCRLSQDEFDKFVLLQRNHGTPKRWGKYNFPYLYIDGYKYWTMGAPINETIIINRQKVFDEYNTIAPVYDSLFNDEFFKKEDQEVAEMLSDSLFGRTLDVGCGTGKLIELMDIDSRFYTGVDPSRAMLNIFSSKFPNYQNKLLCKAFEECCFKDSFETVVSLYGGISYVMCQYIPNIEGMSEHYFLMFYAPGYNPVTYQKSGVKMHHFEYYPSDIRAMLPNATIIPYHNYLIAKK